MFKKIVYISLISVFCFFLLIIGFSKNTSSKYKETDEFETNIGIASWKFKVNGENELVNINLRDTIISNEYSKKDLVPGSEGVFELQFDFDGMEVSTDYSIEISETSLYPTNLHLYFDSEHKREFTKLEPLEDYFDLKDEKTKTHKIYWKWNFSDDNENEWMNKEILFDFSININQRIDGD